MGCAPSQEFQRGPVVASQQPRPTAPPYNQNQQPSSYQQQVPYMPQEQPPQYTKPQAQVAPLQKIDNPPPYEYSSPPADAAKPVVASALPNVAPVIAPSPATLPQRTAPLQPMSAPDPVVQTPVAAPASPVSTAPSSNEASVNIESSPPNDMITREELVEYFNVEEQLRDLEKGNVQKEYENKQQELNRLATATIQLQAQVNEATANCTKEQANANAPKDSSTPYQYAKDLSDTATAQQQTYINALNKLDVVKQQLSGTQQAHDKAEAELQELSLLNAKLQELRTTQDAILNKIFKGQYGSVRENKLEKELDFLLDRQQRINLARSKWLTSKSLVAQACTQMSAGCTKWTEITQLPPADSQGRLALSTEARNHFIAMVQNITAAQRTLPSIKFPYCHLSDISILNTAITNVYHDIALLPRHHLVYNSCYLPMFNRNVALMRWFDQVIAGTIEKDFKDADTNMRRTRLELRAERTNLMAEKLRQDGYTGVLPTAPTESADDGLDDNTSSSNTQPAQASDIPATPPPMPVADELSDGSAETAASSSHNGAIPLDKLAPPPSKADLFGDVQELFAKHTEELKELDRVQEVNKARQEQDLAMKLEARRTHRERQRELATMTAVSATSTAGAAATA